MAERHIAILGIGEFGFSCARNLQGKARVTAIDRSWEAVQRVAPFVTRALLGDATQRSFLEEAGIDGADVAVISLGSRVDSSVLTTFYLKALGIREIVAVSPSTEHARICKLAGATRALVVGKEAAEALAGRILSEVQANKRTGDSCGEPQRKASG